jgi:hypothetical protein
MAREGVSPAGVAEAPKVVLADAGYWHHDQMGQIAGAAGQS